MISGTKSPEQTVLDQITRDLLHQGDEQAYGRLLQAKKALTTLTPAKIGPDFHARLDRLLEDIPIDTKCDCCGYEGLINVRIRGGRTLGPECADEGHSFPCRSHRA